MSPPRRPEDPAAERRFLLARSPAEGRPELAPEEREHALRVLRLGEGDRLVGLDGRGAAWPLFVRAVRREGLELAPAGEPEREPEPGAPGSAVARLEVVLPLPRGARAEALVDRATQLGAAALRFSVTERTRPEARALGGNRARRLERIAAEACKQSGRLWLPEIEPPRPLAELLAEEAVGRRVVLSPDGEAPALGKLAEELATGPAVQLFVGPEGGFTPAELDALAAAGAAPARLGPYVLRVETAAEAALAALAAR